MMKRVEYQPHGVCASKMIIGVEDDIVKEIEIVGGCPGNTMGVSKLCVGMRVEDVIHQLQGIDCRGRGTSCPDQLAKALSSLLVKR